MRSCPICKKDVLPRAENPSFPFCSERCKLIDLGKWLGGDYRIASKREEEEDEQRPAESSDEGDDV
jgi:endogenous inhibitor of DNA gyrase (YacG/DUF329 family)